MFLNRREPWGHEVERRRGGSSDAAEPARLLEGPVLPTLLRLAAPTVALMLLQGVIAAGEAAFVGRLGSARAGGRLLSFPLVMLMTTLSAGAYGGGVASGVARALGAGRAETPRGSPARPWRCPPCWASPPTAVMLAFGRTFYAVLGATGPALDAAVLYSDVLFLGAVPFWLFNAAASVLRGGGERRLPRGGRRRRRSPHAGGFSARHL